MSRSNKLLAGGLFILFITLTAIVMTLGARYKRGLYEVQSQSEMGKGYKRTAYSGVNEIFIRNRANTIIRYGNSVSLETRKDADDMIISRLGGQLILAGRDTTRRGSRSGYTVVVHIPSHTRVRIQNAFVSFEGVKGNAYQSLFVEAENSHVYFNGMMSPLLVDSLTVNASNKSFISLKDLKAGFMGIQLSQSTLDDQSATLGQLMLRTDEQSRLQLQARHLSKIKTF